MDANVVVDGRVVTGRGPAPAMEFALALVEHLYGKGKVHEIAKPMVRMYVRENVTWLADYKPEKQDKDVFFFFTCCLERKRTCVDSFTCQFRLFHTGLIV